MLAASTKSQVPNSWDAVRVPATVLSTSRYWSALGIPDNYKLAALGAVPVHGQKVEDP